MKPRHIVSSVATAVLAIVSVGLVTAQPQPQAGATQVFALHTSAGMDQFIKVDRVNDETIVSFNFTDAALPFVLGPLADMLGGHLGPAGRGVPAVAAAGPRLDVRRLEAGAVAVQNGGNGDVIFTAPARTMQMVEMQQEGIVVGAASEQGDRIAVVRQPGGEPEQVRFAYVARADAPFEVPLSANLVIEDDSARERRVTVSGENLSIGEALEKIASASNCNIFKDGETVVVDWCDAQ